MKLRVATLTAVLVFLVTPWRLVPTAHAEEAETRYLFHSFSMITRGRGSAVLISEQPLCFLIAGHTVAPFGTVEELSRLYSKEFVMMVSPYGGYVIGTVIKRSRETTESRIGDFLGLALVQADLREAKAIPIQGWVPINLVSRAYSYRVGETLAMMGFFEPWLKMGGIRRRNSTLLHTAPIRVLLVGSGVWAYRDTLELLFSEIEPGSVWQGFSGGPVVNTEGMLVGVIQGGGRYQGGENQPRVDAVAFTPIQHIRDFVQDTSCVRK